MKRLLFVFAFFLCAATVYAQPPAITATSTVEFESPAHTAIIPAGQTNAGQPAITSYQASLFLSSADVSTGIPIAVGSVTAKSTAVAQPTNPVRYRLNVTNMFTGANVIPACTQLPCPVYTIVLVSIGPNGTAARGVANESDPFTAAIPTNPGPPANPANVKIVP